MPPVSAFFSFWVRESVRLIEWISNARLYQAGRFFSRTGSRSRQKSPNAGICSNR